MTGVSEPGHILLEKYAIRSRKTGGVAASLLVLDLPSVSEAWHARGIVRRKLENKKQTKMVCMAGSESRKTLDSCPEGERERETVVMFGIA